MRGGSRSTRGTQNRTGVSFNRGPDMSAWWSLNRVLGGPGNHESKDTADRQQNQEGDTADENRCETNAPSLGGRVARYLS